MAAVGFAGGEEYVLFVVFYFYFAGSVAAVRQQPICLSVIADEVCGYISFDRGLEEQIHVVAIAKSGVGKLMFSSVSQHSREKIDRFVRYLTGFAYDRAFHYHVAVGVERAFEFRRPDILEPFAFDFCRVQG